MNTETPALQLETQQQQTLIEMKEDNRHNETLTDQERLKDEAGLNTGADMINKALDRVHKNSIEKSKLDAMKAKATSPTQ